MGDVINLEFHRMRSTNERVNKFRYSAPSRLQNLDDLYEVNTENSINKNQISNVKARSLSDLFTLNNISYIVPSLTGTSDITDINSYCHNSKNMHLNSHTADEQNNNDSKFQSNKTTDINRNGCMNSADKINNRQNGSAHQETNQFASSSSVNNSNTEYLENGISSPKFEELRNSFIILGNDNHNCKKNDKKKNNGSMYNSPLLIDNAPSAITKDLKLDNVAKQSGSEKLPSGNSESSLSNNAEFDDETFVEYREQCMPLKKAVCRSQSESTCQQSPPLVQRRKSVHFADSRGLDLEIRIPFAQADDFKTVPPRLMEALEKVRAEFGGEKSEKVRESGGFNNLLSHFSLMPRFHQPFLNPNFQERVRNQMVCLESVSILPNSHSITGVIRVVNLEFEKRVSVRFTIDDWETQHDIPSCYVSSLSDHNQDQFSFHVVAPKDMHGDAKIEMAICYKLLRGGREFWDNNRDDNYVITYVEHMTSRSDDEMMT